MRAGVQQRLAGGIGDAGEPGALPLVLRPTKYWFPAVQNARQAHAGTVSHTCEFPILRTCCTCTVSVDVFLVCGRDVQPLDFVAETVSTST